MLTRRQFLSLTGGTGMLVGFGGWSELLRDRVQDALARRDGTAGRTLVVVQLGGGNDGLNTLVPDDPRYRDARPRLAVAEADLLRPAGLAGGALHPALGPVVERWEAGDLAIVQGVGYEHPGRSHFECSQHWWDGTGPHVTTTTGWLGRWLDATAPPGGGGPLRALALGAGSPALRAEKERATVVLQPDAFAVRTPPAVDADAFAAALAQTAAPMSAQTLVAAAQAATTAALDAVEQLDGVAAAGPGAPDGGGGGAGGRLEDRLALAADLVVRRLGVEVITLGASGFDTHAGQPGPHAALLADLAGGLDRFWSTVSAAGLADRVLVVTTSEFGRRVAENGSLGTDHGLAGCQLLLGTGIRGRRVVGEIDLGRLDHGDLRPTVDPRSLYATALDWLGGPTDEVLDGYEDLGLLS